MIELLIELDPTIEFDAGQFIVMRAPHIAGFRGYSMVNHPGTVEQATFAVKRKSDGAFTQWLFSQARAGDPIEWFGPLGRAILRRRSSGRSCVSAAAPGSLPSCPSSRLAAPLNFEHFEAAVYFGIRTSADAFYPRPAGALCTSVSKHADNNGRAIPRCPWSRDTRALSIAEIRIGFPHEIAARDLAGRFMVALLMSPARRCWSMSRSGC